MSTPRKMLVTCALPYSNGPLHLGHMVGYIQTDIWVRFQKLQQHDCIFVCGSDSHGTPIMIKADQMGVSPETLVRGMEQEHQKDFAAFNIGVDNYYTTHSPENKALVEMIFKRHVAAGHIHKKTITQLFDPVKKMFLPDRYIKGECPHCHAKDQYGDSCEVCGKTYAPIDLINPYSTLSGATPIEKSSEHYFFKLQEFTNFLEGWTRQNHIQTQVANKLDEWFNDGLREWDISRDAPYFGFTIPGESNKFFYVWLDAPVGYIASFKNLCERRKDLKFDDYWDPYSKIELYHFIGKDIIYFHALFWPAILHGAKLRTPTNIFVNGFLTIDGEKMSKSRGTFIKARTYLEHLPAEYLRYYFAAKLNDCIEDLDIQFDDFMQRINADLVGKFINIASRTASFITKYFDGKLSDTIAEPDLLANFILAGDEIADKYNKREYSQAVRQIMELADRANRYIDEQKPWARIKDLTQQGKVQDVCSMGIQLFRLLALYLKPILPSTVEELERFLAIPPLIWQDKETPLRGHTIKTFKPLIYRIETKQIEALKMAALKDNEAVATTTTTPSPTLKKTPTISIDTFNQVDLRVGKVIAATHVESADKLLKLQIDLGEDKPRQIFAGIKSSYQPEELINRNVIVVANLAPRQMRFGLSEGMVIVAKDEQTGQLFLVSPDEGSAPGMQVK